MSDQKLKGHSEKVMKIILFVMVAWLRSYYAITYTKSSYLLIIHTVGATATCPIASIMTSIISSSKVRRAKGSSICSTITEGLVRSNQFVNSDYKKLE
jgi:hypothetical protein